MIGQIIAFATLVGTHLASHASAGNRDPRDYLTNPQDGLQTKAGQALADVIKTYEDIQAAGQNSPEVIQATIDAVELIRSTFDTKVREQGIIFWGTSGRRAVDTINGLAARLVADRRAELAQLTGLNPAGAAGGNTDSILFVVIAAGVVLLLLLKR